MEAVDGICVELEAVESLQAQALGTEFACDFCCTGTQGKNLLDIPSSKRLWQGASLGYNDDAVLSTFSIIK